MLVENDVAILIASHRCIRTADALDFCLGIVRVLINTLVTETVDASQCTVQLDSGQITAVVTVKLRIEVRQTGLVHRGDLVLVVGKGDVEVCRELTGLDDTATVQVELPSDILHVTGILPAQVGIT